MPLQDYEASSRVTPKMVILDAGRYQVRGPQQRRPLRPLAGCPSSRVRFSGAQGASAASARGSCTKPFPFSLCFPTQSVKKIKIGNVFYKTRPNIYSKN